jgi:membrane protein YqaA with SNARE-associated domain
VNITQLEAQKINERDQAALPIVAFCSSSPIKTVNPESFLAGLISPRAMPSWLLPAAAHRRAGAGLKAIKRRLRT